MMKQAVSRLKPTRGYSHAVHILFNILLPVLAYIFVRTNFVPVALGLVLLSKWRMFAVRPRYWAANIITNAVDILVGVSIIAFMANTNTGWWQLFWMATYGLWLIVLKPRSDPLSVSAQAFIGQVAALSALYLKFGDASMLSLILGTWAITYLCARHFLSSFDEMHVPLIANLWAFFAACLAFVLVHWLLYYGIVAQITLLLSVIGYSLAALYYFETVDRLTVVIRRQLLVIMCAVVLVVIIFSDWSGRTL